MGDSLDPILSPILERDIRVTNTGKRFIKLGDKDIDYDNAFKLYMVSK